MNARILSILLLSLTGTEAKATRAKTVQVTGLPAEYSAWPGHPAEPAGRLFTTLSCPALTRLNLKKGVSEPYLLRSLEESAGEGADWIHKLQLRRGLKWWNGDKITADHLREWIKDNLDILVARSGNGLWQVPPFQVENAGHGVLIRYRQKPVFGPWILNDHAFFRESDSGNWQCAGPYAITDQPGVLQLARTGKRKTWPGKLIFATEGTPTPAGVHELSFGWASHFATSPWTRWPDRRANCATAVDLPLITLIHWNPASPYGGNSAIRKAVTHASPRGAFLRAGAGYLGDLLSGPVLRAHPGYNRKVLVRNYDPNKADQILNKLDYKVSGKRGLRMMPDGGDMLLRFGVMGRSTGLMEKVLSDHFAALGVNARFSGKYSAAEADGILGGLWLPWPDGNLISLFHSGATPGAAPYQLSHKKLDRQLEAYAISLTRQKPEFSQLRKIHRTLYDLEAVSIMLQHRACLIKGAPAIAKVDTRDPDWFMRLLVKKGRLRI